MAWTSLHTRTIAPEPLLLEYRENIANNNIDHP